MPRRRPGPSRGHSGRAGRLPGHGGRGGGAGEEDVAPLPSWTVLALGGRRPPTGSLSWRPSARSTWPPTPTLPATRRPRGSPPRSLATAPPASGCAPRPSHREPVALPARTGRRPRFPGDAPGLRRQTVRLRLHRAPGSRSVAFGGTVHAPSPTAPRGNGGQQGKEAAQGQGPAHGGGFGGAWGAADRLASGRHGVTGRLHPDEGRRPPRATAVAPTRATRSG